MDRRQLLLSGMALALVRPGLSSPGPRPVPLREVRRRAELEGVALLVFLFPKDRAEGARRGRLWGEYLSAGWQEDLYDLALVDRCAATVAEFADEFRLTFGEDDEPFVAIVEPGAATPRVVNLDAFPGRVAHTTFPIHPITGRDLHQFGINQNAETVRRGRARGLGEAFRTLLHPDLDTLVRRAGELELAATFRHHGRERTRARRLGFATRVATWEDRESRRVRELRVTYHELTTPFGRPLPVERATLRAIPDAPAGPHGCHGVPCGTAHIPAPGRQFLELYTSRR